MRNLKLLYALVVTFILSYLTISFVMFDFNPGNWTLTARIICAVVWVILSIFKGLN